ncbi:MAG: hypothetical protein V1773_17745 [bacterium]
MIGKDRIISFTFKFTYLDGKETVFNINIEPVTMNLLHKNDQELPEWVKLEKFKCSHCPLDTEKNVYCPVAVNLIDVIKEFNNVPSYEKVKIEVLSNERGYFKNADIQSGVSSLLGILMVTSGCPIMGKLKPMVRFHLPFATLEETEFKVFSMYLLAQFIRKVHGKEPDWELKNLAKIYDDIKILNQNVAAQIADLEARDASINSVVVLNNFADIVTFNLEDQDLSNFINYYKNYLEEE